VDARLARSRHETSPVRVRIDRANVDGYADFLLAVCEDRSALPAAAGEPAVLGRDPLTGLPDRFELLARLTEAMRRADARGETLGLVVVDVDGVRDVNDGLGRSSGDSLLAQIAQRLVSCAAPQDVVARVEGDAFAVILFAKGRAEHAPGFANNAIAALSRPYDIRGQRIGAVISAGSSTYPGDGFNASELLYHADVAMRQAKAAGRSRYVTYSHEMTARLRSRLSRETSLRCAVERDELRLAFQPVIDLRTGALDSFEALVRWQATAANLLLPEEFIALAADVGVIGEITDWVLGHALPYTRRLREGGADVRVAVNLAPQEIATGHAVIERVEGMLEASGLPPAALELEVPESAYADGDPRIVETLSALRRTGARLTVDDFGMGVASLTLLLDRPVDRLKLSGALTAGIEADSRRQGIVRSLLALGHGLGVECVAKAVSSPAQAVALRTLGVRHAQGYALATPMRGADLAAALAGGRTFLEQLPAVEPVADGTASAAQAAAPAAPAPGAARPLHH
jgi:diguanylate cyclase (GGDEF)-like protein